MKKKTLLFVTIFPLVAVVAYAAVGLLLFMNRDNANAVDTRNKAAVYTVTFDTRGGSVVEAMQIASGQKIGYDNEPIPSKTDYDFSGWYTDIEYKNLFDFQTEIENDLTLYAKWKEIYTVTFESCAGSSVKPARVTNGQTIKMPTPKPTRDNYFFLGWYLDADYTQKFDFATPITGNTTLYAQWARDISDECDFELAADGSYVITGYHGTSTELVIIPQKHEDKAVTSIADHAFEDCTSLTRIIIPENIATVGSKAFADCENLQTIYCAIVMPSDEVPDG